MASCPDVNKDEKLVLLHDVYAYTYPKASTALPLLEMAVVRLASAIGSACGKLNAGNSFNTFESLAVVGRAISGESKQATTMVSKQRVALIVDVDAQYA